MKTNEPLLADDKNSWFRFVLGGFLVWTLLLGITTLSIQHSSSPMLHWESVARQEHCQPNGTDTKCPNPPPDKGGGSDPKHDPNSNPDVIGIVAGVATVVGLVMLAPATPVALIAGVGMMTWFFVRSILSIDS